MIGLLIVLPACAPEAETPGQEAASASPNVVLLAATEYAIDAPDTIPAGWTNLRLANRGGEVHYGHMVRLEPGRTVQDLVAAYAEAIRTSRGRPKWVMRFGGPGGAMPGDSSSVTQFLEPGSYVWICPVEDESGTPHFAKGEFKPFVIRAADAGVAEHAAAPTADMTIRLMDYSFTIDPAPRAGHHTIRVENVGVEPHDLVLMKLAPGKTLEELQAAMNPERARRDAPAEPPAAFETLASSAGGIAVIAPGMQSWFDADLTPGEYVLLCMTTAPDGRSHIEHGMIQRIRVD
jgi:hypothetical protein